MSKPKVRWLLFPLVVAALALLPVGTSGASDSTLLASVECLDCTPHPFICCGECTVKLQLNKCTLGGTGCPTLD